MSVRTLERAIWQETRNILKNQKIRLKDIMAWRLGEVEMEEGEITIKLKENAGISVCVKKELDKR